MSWSDLIWKIILFITMGIISYEFGTFLAEGNKASAIMSFVSWMVIFIMFLKTWKN